MVVVLNRYAWIKTRRPLMTNGVAYLMPTIQIRWQILTTTAEIDEAEKGNPKGLRLL